MSVELSLDASGASHDDIVDAVRAITVGETDRIANAANIAAIIFQHVPQLNWAGFYFLSGGELVLGPFQGKVACTRIALGRGVCGTAAATAQVQLVPDVHAFEGHIACDAASRSEIVVPIIREGAVIGVLDVDSPVVARFGDAERDLMMRIADCL